MYRYHIYSKIFCQKVIILQFMIQIKKKITRNMKEFWGILSCSNFNTHAYDAEIKMELIILNVQCTAYFWFSTVWWGLIVQSVRVVPYKLKHHLVLSGGDDRHPPAPVWTGAVRGLPVLDRLAAACCGPGQQVRQQRLHLPGAEPPQTANGNRRLCRGRQWL